MVMNFTGRNSTTMNTVKTVDSRSELEDPSNWEGKKVKREIGSKSVVLDSLKRKYNGNRKEVTVSSL